MSEPTRCPVCEARSAFSLVERYRALDGILYTIYQCPSCTVQFAHPLTYNANHYADAYRDAAGMLNQVSEAYYHSLKDLEWAYKGCSPAKLFSLLHYSFRFCLRWLQKNLPRGATVLDYGCGSGLVLLALQKLGFNGVGIEVSAELAERLRQKNLNVLVGKNIDAYPAHLPEPQVILLFEIIEHLPDPVGFLKAVHTRFPWARLFLTCPSPVRWQLKLMPRESGDYPPNHLYRWTPKALSWALYKAGFRRCHTFLFAPHPQDINLQLLPYGLGSVLRKTLFRGEERNPWIKKAKFSLLMPVAIYLRAQGYSASNMIVLASA